MNARGPAGSRLLAAAMLCAFAAVLGLLCSGTLSSGHRGGAHHVAVVHHLAITVDHGVGPRPGQPALADTSPDEGSPAAVAGALALTRPAPEPVVVAATRTRGPPADLR